MGYRTPQPLVRGARLPYLPLFAGALVESGQAFVANAPGVDRREPDQGPGNRDHDRAEVRVADASPGGDLDDAAGDHRPDHGAEERSDDSAPESVGEEHREVPQREPDREPDDRGH